MNTTVSSGGQIVQQGSQSGQNRGVSRIAAPQNWSRTPPDQISVVKPPANRLLTDLQAMFLKKQQHDQGTTPAATQETKNRRRRGADPRDNQVHPVTAITRWCPSGLPEQGRHSPFLEAVFPAGNRARAAEKHGDDQAPGMTARQKQQNMSPKTQIGVRLASIVVQQGVAVGR
jgi:hypothetical protein